MSDTIRKNDFILQHVDFGYDLSKAAFFKGIRRPLDLWDNYPSEGHNHFIYFNLRVLPGSSGMSRACLRYTLLCIVVILLVWGKKFLWKARKVAVVVEGCSQNHERHELVASLWIGDSRTHRIQ